MVISVFWTLIFAISDLSIMNYVCKGSKKNLKHKNNLHIISIGGRSLIRTFLAGATKDAAISSKVLSKLKRKSWSQICSVRRNYVPLHPMMSHSTAGGSLSGVHWKQFIAECGIEYGCQFVTPFSLNPPDCLYTKKSREFLQSYEKTMLLSLDRTLYACRSYRIYPSILHQTGS